jgi:hypothetical protein
MKYITENNTENQNSTSDNPEVLVVALTITVVGATKFSFPRLLNEVGFIKEVER